MGSGAIESAIRRVRVLRLKGSCIFWHRENADKMLMLRSFYKAGRWDILKQMANSAFSGLPASRMGMISARNGLNDGKWHHTVVVRKANV